MNHVVNFGNGKGDGEKEIPANERTGSGAYSMAMLCKQDKEQLDRIESMLRAIHEKLICEVTSSANTD